MNEFPKKVFMLDLDGVVFNTRSAFCPRGIDTASVAIVNTLMKLGYYLVLSSTHRLQYETEAECLRFLKSLGINVYKFPKMVHVRYCTPHEVGKRSFEIGNWLGTFRNREAWPDEIVVLDDESRTTDAFLDSVKSVKWIKFDVHNGVTLETIMQLSEIPEVAEFLGHGAPARYR